MKTNKTNNTPKRPAKYKMSTAERPRTEHKKELAKRRDYLLKESIVMLAADLYQDIYNSDDCDGFTDACETIIHLAQKFERKLDWEKNGDNLDYIEELEKFEREVSTILNLPEQSDNERH